MQPYLFYELKLRKTRKATVEALKSRCKVITTYFSTIDFTRKNFLTFVEALDNQGKKRSYTNKLITFAKHIDNYLAQDNPGYKLQLADYRQFRVSYDIPKNTLTLDEIKMLIVVNPPHKRNKEFFIKRDRAMVGLMAETGCRVGELINLKWEDVIDSSGEYYVTFRDTKNYDNRDIPVVSEEIWAMIQAIPRNSEYVFASVKGKILDTSEVRRILNRRAKAAGITKAIYPHLLRHSFGKLANQSKISPFDLQKLMGHRSMDMTAKYANVDMTQKRNAMMTFPLNTAQLPLSKIGELIFADVKNLLAATGCSLDININGDEIVMKVKRNIL
jgi:integrase